jgi:hypothetical protein
LFNRGAVFGDCFIDGAESLVRTLVGGEVNVCFGNLDTSKMHLSPPSTLSTHPLGTLTHSNSSSSIFAALRSGVAKPSVNQS